MITHGVPCLTVRPGPPFTGRKTRHGTRLVRPWAALSPLPGSGQAGKGQRSCLVSESIRELWSVQAGLQVPGTDGGHQDPDQVADRASGSRPRLRYSPHMPTFRIKEAASLLGVSTDTLRRWADAGRIATITDTSGRMAVDGSALAQLAQELAESADHAENRVVVAHSARNRFSGLISRVTRDTVMAQVEIQAGPHRFVSLLSREAADELGLEPGMLAVAAVKATNVSVEIPHS
jgi:molybdopterin-binding protein